MMGNLSAVRSDRLRQIAALGASRSPDFPDVPTMRELGFPEVEMSSWNSIVAPSHLAPEVLVRLNREVQSYLTKPETQSKFAGMGLVARGSTVQQTTALVEKELIRWRDVVERGNITTR
jgi:tripartite-type tricarboxylate transporter receptor subunit TctC